MASPPTIVFVPGAWITPALYQHFLQTLTAAGYNVHYAGYSSLDPVNPSTADCEADAKDVENSLRAVVEDDGKDVLLVMHSYAGMPGTAAAVGLGKSERQQQGLSGGVVGMVFISAFVVPEGLSCAGLQGGSLPPWILLDKPSPKLNVPDNTVGVFAADIDPALVTDLEENIIRPHSNLAFTSPQPHPAWADPAFHGRLGFIVATEDKSVPKEAQYGMMAATQQQWIVKEMACSHFAPFLTRTEETLQLLQDFTGQMM